MIRLVLSDLDNTLVPLGQGTVDAKTLEAIGELASSGVRFGLATGRDIAELTQIFAGETGPFQTGILSNGKKIMVDGQLRHLSLIEREGFARLAEAVRDIPGTFVCGYPLETAADNPVWVFGAQEGEIAAFSRRFAFHALPMDEVPHEDIIGATIACDGPQEQLDHIMREFKRLAPQFDYVQPAENWCDILPAGLNKGTALPLLLSELDATPDEVVFFGDADNDVSLLLSVPNSVVVANATPAAAAAARWQIGSAAEHAVADALLDIADATRHGGIPSFMSERG